jgi:hypothetical protein
LQIGQGIPAPHSQASALVLNPAQGLSGWFSHTHPLLSQTLHKRTVFMFHLRQFRREPRFLLAHFDRVAAGTTESMMTADDKSNRGEPDRSRVSEAEAYEANYFATKYGLTAEEARDLIRKHGNNRDELEAAVGRLKAARQTG